MVLVKSSACFLSSILVAVFAMNCAGEGKHLNDDTAEDTYRIGGTVEGLTGPYAGTMVLQNDGGDDVTLNEDGSFSFLTRLRDAQEYEVTILSKPAYLKCLVQNGTGVVEKADITDIFVECEDKSWHHAETIEDFVSPNPPGTVQEPPYVAMDNIGNALIVWAQHSGTEDQTFISQYRDGSWTHPGGLSDSISPDGGDVRGFGAAMDNNGNAIIGWTQYDGTNRQIFVSEYRDGSWTHPGGLSDSISPDGQDTEDEVDVAMDDSGNALIAWTQHDGTNRQIFVSEYRDGSWAHPGDLSDSISPDGENASGPRVAMDNNGNAIVAWIQRDGGKDKVFMSEHRAASWSIPVTISLDSEHADSVDVAMNDNGNAIVVWAQDYGTDTRIFKSEYSDGSWSDPAESISPDAQSASKPRVAMNNNGDAVVVWQQQPGGFDQVFKSEYRDGSWSTPADPNNNISPDSSHHYNEPRVAMDNHGGTVIVWQGEVAGGRSRVFLSEHRNGAWIHPGSAADFINPASDDGDFSVGSVAMSDSGDAIAAYSGDNGHSSNSVFVSEFR